MFIRLSICLTFSLTFRGALARIIPPYCLGLTYGIDNFSLAGTWLKTTLETFFASSFE